MKYNDAISYLYNLQKYGIKLGLENIKTLSKILGNPQRCYRSIHIAGSNGKGSTAAMLHSILKEEGLKTGLFTSPHLVRFTERIQINGNEITEEDVVSLINEIQGAISATKSFRPTFFEFVTAIAFLYFKREKVDWAVFETGMGGRFDATNVISPALSIITNISEDHKEYLGNSLKEIAKEKAGIMKSNTPVITTPQEWAVLEVITEEAKKNVAPLYIYEKDFQATSIRSHPEGTTFDYHGGNEFHKIRIPLTGNHQAVNASCAIKAWEIIKLRSSEVEKFRSSFRKKLLKEALKKVTWPGRCELVEFKGIPVLLDGAHNPEAMRSLADTIKDIYVYSSKNRSFSRIILIFGTMSDKDTKGMLKKIVPTAKEIIFTAPHYDRAEKPETLKKITETIIDVHRMNISLFVTHHLKDAFLHASNVYRPGDLVVITGSFYTVGEAKEVMGEKTLLQDLSEFR